MTAVQFWIAFVVLFCIVAVPATIYLNRATRRDREKNDLP